MAHCIGSYISDFSHPYSTGRKTEWGGGEGEGWEKKLAKVA